MAKWQNGRMRLLHALLRLADAHPPRTETSRPAAKQHKPSAPRHFATPKDPSAAHPGGFCQLRPPLRSRLSPPCPPQRCLPGCCAARSVDHPRSTYSQVRFASGFLTSSRSRRLVNTLSARPSVYLTKIHNRINNNATSPVALPTAMRSCVRGEAVRQKPARPCWRWWAGVNVGWVRHPA